jgi:hypothetical protein
MPIESLETIADFATALSKPDFKLYSLVMKSTNFLELEDIPPNASNPKGMNFRGARVVSIIPFT